MLRLPRPLHVGLLGVVLLLGAAVCGFWADRRATEQALREAVIQSHSQLGLYASNLHNVIDRYRVMPTVLALDSELRTALASSLTPELQQCLNHKLEQMNDATQASTLEVLNAEGLAIAASNWRQPTSYVGHNYRFRPYFQQAKAVGSGRFYGVGVVTGVAGYFLSQAILGEDGRFLGVMVVKLEFPELERTWRQNDTDIIFVTDARGIAFLANRSEWRYRLLRPLTQADHAALQANRQYHQQPLQALAYSVSPSLAEGHWVQVTTPELAGNYLWTTVLMPDEGWSIHLLRPTAALASGGVAGLAAAAVWLVLGLAALLWMQRRQRRQELEQLVAERTQALRTAQEGLIQAAKLAALGQMSAALAHELNQPLTAQRMQLASLRMLLDQGRPHDAQRMVDKLEELLKRMAALTKHLKNYARQTPNGIREPVDLGLVLDHALELLKPRLHSNAWVIQQHLTRPLWVYGDAIRLEQVLVNLLHNALDAVEGTATPWLKLETHREGAYGCFSVCDNGPGIATEHLSQVFAPFFTTKPMGEGLGLGLAISEAIVHELGGQLRVENTEVGACFRVSIPAVSGA